MFGVVNGDAQTTTGQNAGMIRIETRLNPTRDTSAAIKKALEGCIAPVPDREIWRLSYLGSMLQARGETHYAGKDTSLLTSLIDSLCSG